VKIGRHCRIGGAAMIGGHLEITDGVTLSGGTTITRSVHEKGTYMSVMPFMPQHSWLKNASRIRHLEKLADQVKCLEHELAELKGKSK
jgi:UDP-3-O-[3-hydroxymyristoyl] glucosamine N-acyltransferase